MASCGAPLTPTPGTQTSTTTTTPAPTSTTGSTDLTVTTGTAGPPGTTSTTVTGGTPGKVPLPSLANNADVILVGTVTGVVTDQGRSPGIFTLVNLAVEQVIKGEIITEAIIKVPGGESGGIALNPTDVPAFKAGERVLVFLVKSDASFKVYAGYQGKYTIDNNIVGGGNQTLADFITQVGSYLGK
jgi:hypothetical protein